jgi:VanZ family protein
MVAWTVALEVPIPEPSALPGSEIIVTNKKLIAKSGHVVIYAVMTVLSAWVPLATRYRWLMMLFLMGHATATELLQAALEEYCHRGGSLADVGYDHLGILLGAVISWKWWMRDS